MPQKRGIDEVEATTPPTSSSADSAFPVKKTRLESKAYDIFRLPLTPCEIDAISDQNILGRLSMLAEAFLGWNKDLQAVVAETEELRKELAGARKQIKALVDRKQVKETAAKLAVIAHKEIKKQMKWQPSCKRGSSKWSYTATVPDPAVLFALFNLEAGGKKWKQKKLTLAEFQDALGYIRVSCRYNYLSMTGEHVNLRFDSEALSWSVSGNVWDLKDPSERLLLKEVRDHFWFSTHCEIDRKSADWLQEYDWSLGLTIRDWETFAGSNRQ